MNHKYAMLCAEIVQMDYYGKLTVIEIKKNIVFNYEILICFHAHFLHATLQFDEFYVTYEMVI